MWSSGFRDSDQKDSIRQLSYRQGYFDKTGYYHNRSFDDEAQTHPVRSHGNQGNTDGRYQNSSPSTQRRSSRSSKKRRCSLKTTAVFVAIATFVVIIVGVVIGVVLGAFDSKESDDSSMKETRQISLTGDVILVDTDWSPDLGSKDSKLYKDTEKNFNADMDDLFKKDSTTKYIYSNTAVNEFRPGSIRVIFVIALNEQEEARFSNKDLIDIVVAVLKSSKKIKGESVLVYDSTKSTTNGGQTTSSVTTTTVNTATTLDTTPLPTSRDFNLTSASTTSINSRTTSSATTETITTSGQAEPNTTLSPETMNQTTLASSTMTSSGTCHVSEFRCISDGACIRGDWKCDDWDDCDDASDETDCSCTEDEFRCTDGTCIPDSQKCDGVAQCTDFIDEENCKPPSVECSEEEFKCIKYEECVNVSKVCDGVNDCRDKSDEWLSCNFTNTSWKPTDLEVRLIDKGKQSADRGRVEVRRQGSEDDFGTICGDNWSLEDAMVVCKMLNSSGNAIAHKTAVFGEGTGSILMSRVKCEGTESNIGHCRSQGFGYGLVHCSHSQDAGASCDGQEIATSPAPTIETPDVRLVNGGTCLEGLLQVRHNDEWRFVCDDYFDSRDVTVACRMLGYNAGPGYVDDKFGIGDGVFWLDQVQCQGNEAHIANCSSNPWGDHDCEYYEAVGIVCVGEPLFDCSEKEECISSINCTFDTDDCCYQFPKPSVGGGGSTPWIRHKASQISQVDHTRKDGQGLLMYYRNIFGNADEFAYLKLPYITRTEKQQKLEFYYLITSPEKGSLSLELDAANHEIVWETRVLTSEMDGIWTYGCWDVNAASSADEVSLQFVARRGASNKRVVALDDVTLSEGRCPDISNTKCDFDDFAKCNARILCDNCEKEYRWRWTNNPEVLPENRQLLNGSGYFVYCDSSYGTRGDIAKIEFHHSLKSGLKRGFMFRYLHFSKDDFKHRLKVSVIVNSESSTVWTSKSSSEEGIWTHACVNLPDVDGVVRISFTATRGSNRFGDIIIDDVDMIHSCTHPATCDFETDNCGYEVNAAKTEVYTWDHSKNAGKYSLEEESDIRLVGGNVPYEGRVEVLHKGEWGTVCDDGFNENTAVVICRELGYGFTEVTAFSEAHFGEGEGYIWIDEVECVGTEDGIRECTFNPWGDEDCSHSEDAGVRCGAPNDISLQMTGNYFRIYDTSAPFATWAQFISPRFDIRETLYKLSFKMSKAGTGELQVYLLDESNKRYNLDEYQINTGSVESVCINLNALGTEDTRLVFESTKGRMLAMQGSDKDVDIVAIDDIDVSAGYCTDIYSCSFEQDHRLCRYTAFDNYNDDSSCEPAYMWKRRGGTSDLHGISDHTFGDDTGHFMSVFAINEHPSSPAGIMFDFGTFNSSKNKSFRMFYKVLKEPRVSSALQLKVGNNDVDIRINGTNPSGWIPLCTEVIVDADSTVSVLIMAVDVTIAIDDVSLNEGVCPDVSATCLFKEDFLCGYSTGTGWKHIIEIQGASNHLGYVRAVHSGPEFVSPTVRYIDGSVICISADVRTSHDLQIDAAPRLHLAIRDVTNNAELLLRHASLPVTRAEWQTLKYQVSNVEDDFSIAWKVTLEESEYLDIRSISAENGYCIPQICSHDEFVCDGGDYSFCLPLLQACENIDICPNAANTVCLPSVSCDFNDRDAACGWTLNGAIVKEDDNLDKAIYFGDDPFTFAETPTIRVSENSCLTFTMVRDFNDNLFRILLNNSNDLVELHNFHMYKSQGRVQVVELELPVGNYSLVFECQQTNTDTAYIIIDNVSVLNGTCISNLDETTRYKCKTDDTYGSIGSISFPNDDVACDKFIDCPNGSDEKECNYTFDCDFDTSVCGYEISNGISIVELPHMLNETNATIIAGNKTENGKCLLYNSMLYGQVNFTTGPIDVLTDTCAVSMNIWTQKVQQLIQENAYIFITADFVDDNRRANTFTSYINLNVTGSWFTFFISLDESNIKFGDGMVGSLPKGRYLPSFSFVGYGVYVAIDNIARKSCDDTDKAAVLPPDFSENNNSTNNLPENFPISAIDINHVAADYLHTALLLCTIENLGASKVSLYWYKGDVQISRNEEIINQDVTTAFDEKMLKYTVTVENNSAFQTVNYSLEINRVTELDTGRYICKIEVDGITDVSNVYVTVNMHQIVGEHGCYKNTLPTCHVLGFKEILPQGPFGYREIEDAALPIQDIEHSRDFLNMSQSCKRSVMSLQCGMFLTKCQDGIPIQICREHCESIVEGCQLRHFDSDLYKKLKRGCKFLPFANDGAECVPIITGCGMKYTGPSGSLVSINYPDPYPLNTRCDWNIAVEPYHIIKFDVVNYNVGINNGSSVNCGLYVTDNTNSTLLTFNCGEEIPSMFLSSGNVVTLTFKSDSVSSGNGFFIRYRQISKDTCISRSGENTLHLSSSNDQFNETCNKMKIYLQDSRDTLNVMVGYLTDGCLTLVNGLQLNVTLCNITEVHQFTVRGYIDIHIESPALVYKITTTKTSYVRAVEDVSIDHSGRLQVLSEGEFGTFCGDLDQVVADMICKSKNYGWPAHIEKDVALPETLPRLVSEIRCSGEEQDISHCNFVFAPLESETCMESFYATQTLTCPRTTVSCDFTKSTCGYILGDHVNFSPIYGLHHVDNSLIPKSDAMSVTFSYTAGIYLHVEYVIRRGAIGDRISIKLVQSSNDHSIGLWQWKSFTTYGIFKGCAEMPSLSSSEDDSFQLVVEYTSGEKMFNDPSSEYTGLKKLELSFEKCINETVELKCSFEDLDDCAHFINVDYISCPGKQTNNGTVLVTSRSSYSPEEWIQTDHTYRNKTGHYLLVGEGTILPFIRLANISKQLNFLHLYFGINNGVDAKKNSMLKLYADDQKIYETQTVGSDWTEACIDISDSSATTITLDFGDEQLDTGNLERMTALLAIDDIGFTSVPCKYYLNCDFESDCSMNYYSISFASDDKVQYEWIIEKASDDQDYMPSSDGTYSSMNKGSYMRADFAGADEGSMAILKSRDIHKTDNMKCVSFKYYIYGNTHPGSLQVTLNKGEDGYEKFEVTGGKSEDKWYMYKVALLQNVRYIQFEAIKGISEGTIAIDDVIFTTESCNVGLDNLEYCTFDDPEECGIDQGIDEWKNGLAKDLSQYIMFDANLNSNGYVQYILPTTIPDKQESVIRFYVKTNKSAFQFSYIFTGGMVGNLSTEINGQKTYIVNKIANTWMESECVSVPNRYEGVITVGIAYGDSDVDLVAIDNVRLLNKDDCKDEPSLTCNFGLGNDCNFKSVDNSWTFSNKFTIYRSGFLQAPVLVVDNRTQHCFGFSYRVISVDSIDTPANLILYSDTKTIWNSRGHVGISAKTSGQVTLEGGVLRLKFESEGRGLFEIYETKLLSGVCVDITDCSEFLCSDRCLSKDKKCDRIVDCLLGEDESGDICGFQFNLNFSKVSDIGMTGFETPEISDNEWKLVSNLTLTVDGSEINLSDKTLLTYFTRVNPKPSVIESFEYHLEVDSCLQIDYISNAAFGKIELNYQREDEKQTETIFHIEPSSSTRHISVPVKSGNVKVLLSVYMIKLQPFYTSHIQLSAVFAIKHLTMHSGKSCSELLVECPDDIPNLCADKQSCYTDERMCDLVPNCYDKSDELENCGYGIVCNFEHKNLCGYTNDTLAKTYWDDRDVIEMKQSLWERTASMPITRPPTDHTYQVSGKGHFMTSKNHEGLLDEIRYVDVETMTSPFTTFNEDGCITFWYYLNSTFHQPKSTSAQLFVYLQYQDSMEKKLLWFDHINRPFPTWSQGGISVEGNLSVRLIVTAKTSIPFDAFTGVVSFDDVEFSSGECLIPKLDCDEDMFKCSEDKICIPYSMVCDGEPDCLDTSDEQSCDRPNGALQLVGGDGTYGKLAYFYSGVWRPVCYPKTDYEQTLFNLHAAHYVCQKLHFRGNSDAFSYRLWEKHSPTKVKFSCDEDGTCSARATIDECDTFAYIRCSNDVCFSGERLCPGTRATCLPESYFCDGQQDCPENMDEKQCLCYEGEEQCLHTPEECNDQSCETCEDRGMFGCQNHQCIPLKNRCDGIKQCYDGTDEYRCVQINKDMEVTVFLNSTLNRETVCGEDVTLNAAERLCRLAGQGYVSEIKIGSTPVEKGITSKEFNEKLNCYPLILRCQLPECGRTVVQDSMIQPSIINGRDTTVEEWPWYGALLMEEYFICGVTLIHPSWAITVSHCLTVLKDKKIRVSFGTNSLAYDGEFHQGVNVVKTYEYGYINSDYPSHDITLLKLEHPVLISNVTRPVCLPKMTSLDDVIRRGSQAECYVIGLGLTEQYFSDPNVGAEIPDVLQKKRVHIVSYDYCKHIWLSETEGDGTFPNDIVCIATEGPSSPTCLGDSGSPLMCRADTGRWELIGTVSFGYGNCFHDVIPTVMTSVTSYEKWIRETTGIK